MPVGLFLTDKSIKIAKLTGKKSIFIKIPLEDGLLEDGLIKDEEKFKSILVEVAREVGSEKKEVVLGISEKNIFTKTITVSTRDGNLEERIKEELEPYLPLPLGQLYTDWQILEEKDDSQRILIVSTPAVFLDNYINLLKAAAINVVGIEPLTFALSRKVASKNLSQVTKASANLPASLIIAFEEDEVFFVILDENSRVELTSVLSYKTPDQRSELLSEFFIMRTFYEKKNPGKKIGKLFITGEGVTDELKNQISSYISIESEFLRIENPLVSISDSLSFLAVLSLTDLPVTCPKDHRYINLLPEKMMILQEKAKKEAHIKRLLTISAGFLTTFCFLYLLLLTYFFFESQSLNRDITRQKSFLSGNLGGVKQNLININREIGIVKRVRTKNDHLFDVLSFLTEKTPGGIVIKNYKIDLLQNTIFVGGLSLERERLLSFKQILEEDGKFKEVNIPLTDLEKKGMTTFSLSFTGGSE